MSLAVVVDRTREGEGEGGGGGGRVDLFIDGCCISFVLCVKFSLLVLTVKLF